MMSVLSRNADWLGSGMGNPQIRFSRSVFLKRRVAHQVFTLRFFTSR